MAAAIVKLDALADPVRAATENNDLLGCTWRSLAFRLIGGVHIRRGGREFSCAGVDALIGRADASRATGSPHFKLGLARDLGQAPVRKPLRLHKAPVRCGLG